MGSMSMGMPGLMPSLGAAIPGMGLQLPNGMSLPAMPDVEALAKQANRMAGMPLVNAALDLGDDDSSRKKKKKKKKKKKDRSRSGGDGRDAPPGPPPDVLPPQMELRPPVAAPEIPEPQEQEGHSLDKVKVAPPEDEPPQEGESLDKVQTQESNEEKSPVLMVTLLLAYLGVHEWSEEEMKVGLEGMSQDLAKALGLKKKQVKELYLEDLQSPSGERKTMAVFHWHMRKKTGPTAASVLKDQLLVTLGKKGISEYKIEPESIKVTVPEIDEPPSQQPAPPMMTKSEPQENADSKAGIIESKKRKREPEEEPQPKKKLKS